MVAQKTSVGSAVPFVPRRRLALVQHAPRRSSSARRRCLQRRLPDSWRLAEQMAADLARQIQHLAWADRSETFDAWFLRQAETMLTPAGVSTLISGDGAASDPPEATVEERAARFGTWSRAVVMAVLAELAETSEVDNPHQALTHLLSGDFRLARTAAAWTAERGKAPLQTVLRELPGYALVLLAASPNDTAERFMARDAFWAAVMRRS